MIESVPRSPNSPAASDTRHQRPYPFGVLQAGPTQQSPTQLADVDGITVVNKVVLNQVLVRFGENDATTDRVIEAVQRSGECWMGSTTWHGQRLMRISVSSWRTTEADIDRSARAILAAAIH